MNDNWYTIRSWDGFIGELSPDRDITFKYELDVVHDYDHSQCKKCATAWDIAGFFPECILTLDVLTGVAATECNCKRFTKAAVPVFTLSFFCLRKNGTAFNAALLATTGAEEEDSAEKEEYEVVISQ